MPGVHMELLLVPRYVFSVNGRIVYAPKAWGFVRSVAPIADGGCYMLESTAAQNLYDMKVYSTVVPWGFALLNSPWEEEAMRFVDHPIFGELVQAMQPLPYQHGRGQAPLLLARFAGSFIKKFYVMADYSGAIDVWARDDLMVERQYAVYRLVGVLSVFHWWRCTSMTFLRMDVHHDPPRSRY